MVREIKKFIRILVETERASTYKSWNTDEVAIFFRHHVGAFRIVIRLSLSVGVPGRVKGNSIQGPMTLNAVHDLVDRRGPQCLFIGLLQRLNGALLAVPVSLGIDGVIGTLVVILEVTHVVEAVDHIWPHSHLAPARMVMATTIRVGLMNVGVVDCPRLAFQRLVRRERIRSTESVHGLRSHRRRAAERIGVVHVEMVSRAIHF